jgi:hypothetical protein
VQIEGFEPYCFYDWLLADGLGRSPDEVAAITTSARDRASSNQRVRVGFKLAPDPLNPSKGIVSEENCRDCVRAALCNGADGVFFFNYSEVSRANLNWVKLALAETQSASAAIGPTFGRECV